MLSRFLLRRVPSLYHGSVNYRYAGTAFSTFVQNLGSVHQGGSIFLDATNMSSEVSATHVRITSVWQDHCEVHWRSEEEKNSGAVTVTEGDDGSAYITFDGSKQLQHEHKSAIDIRVPEIVNIYIRGVHMNLEMKNKIQGDVSIDTQKGSVALDKVRGENIDLLIGDATLNVKKVIEASALNIRCSKLDAKMINGDFIDVNCTGGVQLGAMYSKEARLVSSKGVNLRGLHGNVQIVNDEEDVEVNGVDGIISILNKRGDVSVQVNKLKSSMRSSIECQHGSVTTQINPEISVSLEVDSRESLKMNTKNFFEQSRLSPTKMKGTLEAVTSDVKNKGRSTLISGKIDLLSAQRYALHAERFGNNGDDDGTSTDNSMREFEGDKDIPYLLITASKDITVKTLSWMDAIKEKFGFLEEEKHVEG